MNPARGDMPEAMEQLNRELPSSRNQIEMVSPPPSAPSTQLSP